MAGLLIRGDARTLPIAEGTVDCIVTSPPYFGLRDYGTPGQLGLEATPDAYVAALVACAREWWRVLKPTGTLWLNLGDSYAGSWGNQGRTETRGAQRPINGTMLQVVHDGRYPEHGSHTGSLERTPGLKPKDLVGIPWRVAFALQADGWYLRSDIIWAKPNPMPESVTDRPTKAHEYVFLLAKSERYYYDADAIREPHKPESLNRYEYGLNVRRNPLATAKEHRRREAGIGSSDRLGDFINYDGANIRSVWTITTEPYPDAHFATFPETLPTRCILAGAPMGGVVLDPFCGTGTVGVVAERLGRHWIGVDLTYHALARVRTAQRGLMFGVAAAL